jgi:HEAT repeat protein
MDRSVGASMSACDFCHERLEELSARCPRCRAFSANGLMQLLRDTRPEIRARAAADMFFLVPSAQVAEALAGALNDPVVEVRRAAGVTLFIAASQARTTVPALVAALDDADRLVRRAAAAALWTLGPAARDALPKLATLRESEDKRLRGWAAQAEKAIQRPGS